jgi:hypothetical protein
VHADGESPEDIGGRSMSNRVTTGRPLGVDRTDQPCDNHATDRTAQWFAAIIKEAPEAY